MELLNEWGLTVVVFLPALGALVMAAIPRSNETAVKRLGALVAVATFLISLLIAFNFDYSQASAYQFEVSHSWISAINANYHVGIDGISLPLLILSTFIVLLSVIYSWDHWEEPRNPKAFLILTLNSNSTHRSIHKQLPSSAGLSLTTARATSVSGLSAGAGMNAKTSFSRTANYEMSMTEYYPGGIFTCF